MPRKSLSKIKTVWKCPSCDVTITNDGVKPMQCICGFKEMKPIKKIVKR